MFENIVFFDGICNLCNWSVNLLIKLDKRKVLKYSSLQGECAEKILKNSDLESLSSLIFFHQGRSYRKSKAVIEILLQLGGVYKFFGRALCIFPQRFLDFLYDLIAKNRYRIFGYKKVCRLPSEEEKALFIR